MTRADYAGKFRREVKQCPTCGSLDPKHRVPGSYLNAHNAPVLACPDWWHKKLGEETEVIDAALLEMFREELTDLALREMDSRGEHTPQGRAYHTAALKLQRILDGEVA